MTERDLESLKHLAVPEARPESRRAAIDAALAAFDAEATTALEVACSAPPAVQGNTDAVRPIRRLGRTRSFLMGLSSHQNMAIAASLAALAIIGPIAFKIYDVKRGWPEAETPRPETVAVVPQQPVAQKAKKIASQPPAPAKLDSPDFLGRSAPEPRTEAQPSTLGVAGPYAKGQATGGEVSGSLDGTLNSESSLPAPAPPPPAYLAAPSPAPRADPGYALGFDAGKPAPDALANLTSRRLQFETAMEEKRSYPGFEGDAKVAQPAAENRDIFDSPEASPVKQVTTEPVSTFSFDVDTASYSYVRRALNAGHLPPKQAVRVEELINYFPYSYPAPQSADVPFKPTVTVMPSPWKPTDKLVHIAIKGYDLKSAERPRANLVFLIDVSGSMEPDDRLPLIKNALRLLVDQLRPNDTVGIVTYASGSGIALEPTKITDKTKIFVAIDKLQAGGSTDGADGIADAYRLAEAGFDKAAVNRIVLATDGDFNVGITDRDQLKSYVERKRKSGVYLSILGVGEGNHNDALMQALAQNGNGTAAYVDTLNEARKVLVDEASSTLFTIAKDVKAQVEWNPARVSEYRLIGYETRALKREDFNNDEVDAGDIGSGHTVTAIYEVTPTGAPRLVDDLRYAKPAPVSASSPSEPEELGFLKLRYKKPSASASELISVPIGDNQEKRSLDEVPADVRFSVAIAAFGDLLRGAPYEGGYTFDDVVTLAQSARGDDPYGYRAEFLNLVRLAKSARP